MLSSLFFEKCFSCLTFFLFKVLLLLTCVCMMTDCWWPTPNVVKNFHTFTWKIQNTAQRFFDSVFHVAIYKRKSIIKWQSMFVTSGYWTPHLYISHWCGGEGCSHRTVPQLFMHPPPINSKVAYDCVRLFCNQPTRKNCVLSLPGQSIKYSQETWSRIVASV